MAKEDSNSEREPSWKSDFPIETRRGTHVSRREFAKFLGLLSGAFALSNGFIVIKAMAFPAEKLEGEHFVVNENEVGVGEMFQFEIHGAKKIPYILIHLKENEWRAFEQKCTHLTCAVRYRKDENKIECPCHNGWFSADTGEVLQGPPPRPLPQLEVVIKEGKVYVKEENEDQNIL
ncbi:QcrA and Rieske domain-containing protein [Salegentibacter salegens]|uniref:Rieske Fe-S protein n=1 Tax=Salegentibacter salegens TaxID=143223 RepID=A0A1M7L3M3_9FLAO|nr:Rieske (2Fe-2S) protein [Salegentibacter salegens]PRX44825.1 Rieske Fe-S protein [Salegentibacter salegens]SHM72454.1 Rieske Fe-S protein [Salegentibacter salegens]